MGFTRCCKVYVVPSLYCDAKTQLIMHQIQIRWTHLRNSSAPALIDFRSARSTGRKIASFPVMFFSSEIVDCALALLLHAIYTFALRKSSTCQTERFGLSTRLLKSWSDGP